MSMSDIVERIGTGGMSLTRARVTRVDAGGRIHVTPERGSEVGCDVLAGVVSARPLAPGDEVLIAMPHRKGGNPVLLGAIETAPAAPHGPVPVAASAGTETPAETTTLRNARIVIEAGEELVLRCGPGTVTLRQDGKIIISGEHVLSRARGTQRIKGGSVAIN